MNGCGKRSKRSERSGFSGEVEYGAQAINESHGKKIFAVTTAIASTAAVNAPGTLR